MDLGDNWIERLKDWKLRRLRKIVGVQFIEPEKYIGNGLDKSSPYNELKWSGSDLGLGSCQVI